MKLKIFIIMAIILAIRFTLPEESTPDTVTQQNKNESLKNINIEKFNVVEFMENIKFYGKTKPYRETEYILPNNRKVGFVNKKEGDFVKEGDLILSLDKKDLEIELESIKINIKSLEIEMESIKRLVEKRMESEFKYKKALSNLELQKSKLEKINTEIDNSNIIAIFDGTLENFDIEKGEYIQNRSIRLIDNSSLTTEFYISSKNIRKIELKKPVVVIVNDLKLEGEVEFISKSASNDSNTFLIKAKIDNKLNLPSGMPSTVFMNISKHNGIEISPFLLSSDDYGYYLKEIINNKVEKLPAKIVKTSDNGVWVSINKNINSQIDIATLGHILIKIGDSIYEETK